MAVKSYVPLGQESDGVYFPQARFAELPGMIDAVTSARLPLSYANQAVMRRSDWTPDLTRYRVPLLEGIAQSIADDIADGKLRSGDRLPTQRALAKQINLDVTTVARGSAEAGRLSWSKPNGIHQE